MRFWRRAFGSKDMAMCAEVIQSLEAYIDGELRDEITARRIASHLEVCRRCGLEARTLRELKSKLKRLERVDVGTVGKLKEFAWSLADDFVSAEIDEA